MRPFQLLVKPVSGECNLTCDYCFYLDVPERCYPEEEKTFMSLETLQELVRGYLRLGFSPSVLSWQGGEPTLAGLEFFKKALELESKFGHRGQKIGNALQTNGTMINSDWAQFLADYKFLVGLSIDGPKEIHDSARGEGTWQQAMDCADLLRRHGVHFNVLTVIHHRNMTEAQEIYRFHRQQGFKHLQFVPALDIDPNTGKAKEYSIDPREYGEFLCGLFDEWMREEDSQCVNIRLFEALRGKIAGCKSTSLCTISGECGRYLVVEHNGDVYPCDFFVYPEEYLGNFKDKPWTELLSNRAEFEQKKAQAKGECEDCPWWHLCHGGCPKNRIQDSHTVLCEGYKLFFSHIQSRMDSKKNFVQ
ncbi:MAG: anaerobic sulfatase maturase [Candidatus Thorarchaeota archaeon]|nr:anaerobic sulfatase maturase [Candidatus Thorarchaeota archaeon]